MVLHADLCSTSWGCVQQAAASVTPHNKTEMCQESIVSYISALRQACLIPHMQYIRRQLVPINNCCEVGQHVYAHMWIDAATGLPSMLTAADLVILSKLANCLTTDVHEGYGLGQHHLLACYRTSCLQSFALSAVD